MNKSESKYFNTARKFDDALIFLLEKKDLEYISVKEICETAGVNRSTFYLHYETIGDLLDECIEQMNQKFLSFYSDAPKKFLDSISEYSLKELNLITPEYLLPYLNFIQSNKHIFRAALSHPSGLNAEKSYRKMYKHIFTPILERFHCPQEMHVYIVSFYMQGIMAIVEEWLKQDCKTEVEAIMQLIIDCVSLNDSKLVKHNDL